MHTILVFFSMQFTRKGKEVAMYKYITYNV
jgi:hypothetical protein